jgi:SAM-dependent methyltransferase
MHDARCPKYDILNLSIPSNSVDIVVCDQVLEHLNGSPYQAFDETLRVLKSGGVFCHTTCFLGGGFNWLMTHWSAGLWPASGRGARAPTTLSPID